MLNLSVSKFANSLPKPPEKLVAGLIKWFDGAAFLGVSGTGPGAGNGLLIGFSSYDAALQNLASMKGWQMTLPGWRFQDGFIYATADRSIGVLLSPPAKANYLRTSAGPYLNRSYPGPALAAADSIYGQIPLAVVFESVKPIQNPWFNLSPLK
jgi:hypothetical protein